jgi:DNA ligase (NAD+)
MDEVFQIPSFCPACSGPVIPEGFFLYCRNRGCPAKLAGSVKVWIKRLGLLHWGDALVDELTNPNSPKIQTIGDLYRLTIDDLTLCTSGPKMAKKCYEVLHSNKSIPLELMLASLNIPNFALATATDIVQAGYDTVEKVLGLTYDDLQKVPNIGEVTAAQVVSGLEERRDAIMDLAGVLDIKKAISGPLSGKSFCITEATSKPRKAIEKLIMDAGGVAKSSVGKELSYLVTNYPNTTSSKMQNAKKYGIPVISENELYRMIGS